MCPCLTPSHLDISTSRDLDPISPVSNHIILRNLPVTIEADTVAAVFIDAVTTKLHPAVLFHHDAASTVFENAVGDESRHLTALQDGNARAAVAVYEVSEHVQGLAALHVQADCCDEDTERTFEKEIKRGTPCAFRCRSV